MTVGDLLSILADGYVSASDVVVGLGKDRIVIGRGPLVVAVVDLARGTLTKGVGIRADADACTPMERPTQ